MGYLAQSNWVFSLVNAAVSFSPSLRHIPILIFNLGGEGAHDKNSSPKLFSEGISK